MQSRAQKTRRVAHVQAQLRRIEEFKLAELERRLAEGEATQRALIAALNENHPLYDLFIDAMARRLRALAEETSRIRETRDVQARRLIACAGRLKSAERLAAAADRAERRQIGKMELLDTIDALVTEGDASLPQVDRPIMGRQHG